ncbi:MAG TPA: nitrate- and nitrite sensing domain-containing protein, partial [Streptosporangiaceae bacterium]
ATARTALLNLRYLRAAATGSQLPALVVVQKYATVIEELLGLIDVTGQGASDATLGQAIRVLGLVSRMKEEASEQRAILTYGLLASQLNPNELTALNSAVSEQQSNLASFNSTASVAQRNVWNNSVATSFVFEANAEETQAITTQNRTKSLASDNISADDWYGAMSNEIDSQMGSVEQSLAGQISSRAAALHRSALTAAIVVGAAVLLVLALSLFLTVIIGRSMVRPLRRLRAGALEVAGVRLPEMVRRMSEADGGGSFEVAPIDVDSSDEIGEVARAFDQVHREAVRLAADEAMLRGNLNAMFVNLSRRSQSLIERQISLIDSLEQGEQDSGRLSSLFRLDHLATRMRRNSENLLVLAGHEASRRWSQPVPLVDVLRAAISEIEQYERVVLNVQPGIAIVGQAVNDVVHLVAELVENATTFSPEDTQVYVSGQPLTSGGVLLDISDSGVGISEQEMAHANWRLDNPPVVDVGVSRRMGLFVVGRLAARHGVRVRLRHAPSGGLTALVWLPDTVAAQEGTPLGRLRRFEVEDYGPGPSLSAPPAGGAGGALPSRPGFSQSTGAAAQAAAAARIPRFSPPSGSPSAPPGNSPQPTAGPGAQPVAGPPANGGAGRTGSFAAMPPGPGPSPGPAAPANGFGPSGPGGPGGGAGGPGNSAGLPQRPVPASPPGPQGPPGPANGSGGAPDGGVRVPAPAETGHDQRLPIFDSLESDWFRRSGAKHANAQDPAGVPDRGSWNSPADEGWRAAQTVAAPATGATTSAGLPRRVPRANLVPGSVGDPAASGEGPSRSAEEVRSRLASFQRGVREARAAAPKTEEP